MIITKIVLKLADQINNFMVDTRTQLISGWLLFLTINKVDNILKSKALKSEGHTNEH